MKRIILILWVCFAGLYSYAQLDTVYVSPHATVSMVFSEKITLVDIGSEDCFFEYDDQVLLIKAITKLEQLTSLFVRYGKDRYYACFLDYQTDLDQFHYDLRDEPSIRLQAVDTAFTAKSFQMPLSPNSTAQDILPKGISKETVTARLSHLDSLDRELFTVGAIANNIAVSVENVRNDQALSYFKLSMLNQSSIPYLVEFVGFQYREPAEKKGLSDMVTEIQPVLYQVPDTVGTYACEEFLFALPHFATPRRGRLEVIFRERNGTRSISFQAPSNLVLRAKLISL